MSIPLYLMIEGQELVLLPRTPEELDTFVISITEEYGLPPGDGTYEAIATAIMHMPSNKAYAPRLIFGHSGLKQMANTAAYTRLQEINQRRHAAQQAAKEELEKKMKGEQPSGDLPDGQSLQDS